MYSGISVAEVASSDVMTNAVAQELATYWPMERELLASILEMLHILVLTTQSAFGGKNLPKPLHIQRPTEGLTARAAQQAPAGKAPASVISMSEFVRRDQSGDL